MFTEQVRSVFQALKAVEDEAGKSYGPGRIKVTIYTPIQWVDPWHCNHHLFPSRRIQLLSPRSLPALQSIRGLSVCNPDDSGNFHACNRAKSKLDLRVLVDIATRLPNLEYLGCKLGVEDGRTPTNDDPALQHFQRDFEGCQRDSRHGFTKALEAAADMLPKSLRYVQLDLLSDIAEHLREQQGGGPNFASPASRDHFSSSLRTFASGLRHVELRLIADETLFWPLDGGVSCWPNVEVLNVMFHIVTPSGSWYFRGPRREGNDDTGYTITDKMYPPLTNSNARDAPWHHRDMLGWSDNTAPQLRVVPIEETLASFLTAFAKAAANMHALKAATLWAPLKFTPMYDDFDVSTVGRYPSAQLGWGIAYIRPGETALYNSPGEDHSSSRQLWWKVGHWRPDAALRALFRDIGCAKYGGELVDYWDDETYGGGLVERELFEQNGTAFPRFAEEHRDMFWRAG